MNKVQSWNYGYYDRVGIMNKVQTHRVGIMDNMIELVL